MEITILIIFFSLTLLLVYLAFVRTYDIRGMQFCLGFLAGSALIIMGLFLFDDITYIGWASMNVDPYTIISNSHNGSYNWLAGVFFIFTGFVIWVLVILNEMFGGEVSKVNYSAGQLVDRGELGELK